MGFKLSKSFGWTLARDSNPGGGVPAGYTRSTINGVPVTYNGRRVYDNGSNVIYL